jgi:hypothetical protein
MYCFIEHPDHLQDSLATARSRILLGQFMCAFVIVKSSEPSFLSCHCPPVANPVGGKARLVTSQNPFKETPLLSTFNGVHRPPKYCPPWRMLYAVWCSETKGEGEGEVDGGLAADDGVLADRDSLSTNKQLVVIAEAMQSSHYIENLTSGGKRIASPSSFTYPGRTDQRADAGFCDESAKENSQYRRVDEKAWNNLTFGRP